MSWALTKNCKPILLRDIPELSADELRDEAMKMLEADKRLVLFFGVNRPDKNVSVYCVFADDDNSGLHVASVRMPPEKGSLETLSETYPSFFVFERELYEDFNIVPSGHPSLNPVRRIFGSAAHPASTEQFAFSRIEGEEVHEVGVGPIHAGIIEPGHFRFSCLGETVHNLEIHLGYQHRGVERLMETEYNARTRMRLCESIAGDTVIGHGLAYAQAAESLTDTDVPSRAQAIRGIALELERAAVHTGDLSALCNDVAYLPGNAVFGATRTILINTLLEICGSRFGRNLLCEGGVAFDIDTNTISTIKKNVSNVRKRIELGCSVLFSTPSVLARFESTGTVSLNDAKAIGLVGPAARASGVPIDIRSDHPHGIYGIIPMHKITLSSGDVFARAYIRYVEITRSLDFIEELVSSLPKGEIVSSCAQTPAASSLSVSLVEGWRGEIAHCAVTDDNGKIVRYKIKDPSFNNWQGLESAVRGNGISDFPLCNKSFNLSYCGYDL